MTLEYCDLDTIISDFKELIKKSENRCNVLKREYESERSIGYQILEDYFYNIKKILEENDKYITPNLNSITNLDLNENNIFYKMLTK